MQYYSFTVGAYNFTYLGSDLIKLTPYSHLWCTEVVKGELTRQLQPSSCGRSVVTHITLQYCVVPPSVDWRCVCVRYSTFLRSSEGLHMLIAQGLTTPFSLVSYMMPQRNVLCLTSSKVVSSTCTSVLTSVCWLAHTCACVCCEKDLFVFFVLFLHRLWATSNTLVSRRWACNWS